MTPESLIDDIISLDSLAITGMVKNAGKTECLNFILNGLSRRNVFPAVTSIGVDGESNDVITNTKKPEIILFPGDFFVTAESFYRKRKLVSEIISINPGGTTMGRLITARAVTPGKIILSGPPDTIGIRNVIDRFLLKGIKPVIIDGALSRKSLGAPSVTSAMILATGAALSPSLDEVIKKTSFICELIDLPRASEEICLAFEHVDNGAWIYDSQEGPTYLSFSSALQLHKNINHVADILSKKKEKIIFLSGIVTDSILDDLEKIAGNDRITLIIKDFTSLFLSFLKYRVFLKKNNEIKVLKKPRLLAITVNPHSPLGYTFDSESLCYRLFEATGHPIIDVVSKYSVS